MMSAPTTLVCSVVVKRSKRDFMACGVVSERGGRKRSLVSPELLTRTSRRSNFEETRERVTETDEG